VLASLVVSSASGAGFIDFPRARLRAFSSSTGIIFRNMAFALYGALITTGVLRRSRRCRDTAPRGAALRVVTRCLIYTHGVRCWVAHVEHCSTMTLAGVVDWLAGGGDEVERGQGG